MTVTDEPVAGVAPGPGSETPASTPAPADGWRRDKGGREYAPAAGRSGVIYRRGQETVEEALARDSRPDKDRKPPRRRKPKLPPKEKSAQELQELEHALAKAFSAPGDIADAFGDEFLAAHFRVRGPLLARVLVNAAQQNPWLRRKLEQLTDGGAAAMQAQALLALAITTAGYVLPPVVYLTGKQELVPGPVMFLIGGEIPQRPAREPASVAFDMGQGEDAGAA